MRLNRSIIGESNPTEVPYQAIVPEDDIRPDTPEPERVDDLKPPFSAGNAQSDAPEYSPNDWQSYSLEELAEAHVRDNREPEGDSNNAVEPTHEPQLEPEPEPEPVYNEEGQLIARAKGKGRARGRRTRAHA
ncbi:hypothetical protein RhiJN_05869 [Ceratobasidium sp. AG-Ba]|nr:hypothetical protein RhiJN_05869 [Ceratobasidium sp. AG-Ba]QRW06798.1 hypothetical protein RhiLY_05797 [Ceratobasidium sp. AG-Ba]